MAAPDESNRPWLFLLPAIFESGDESEIDNFDAECRQKGFITQKWNGAGRIFIVVDKPNEGDDE